jgi:hypothetical protein
MPGRLLLLAVAAAQAGDAPAEGRSAWDCRFTQVTRCSPSGCSQEAAAGRRAAIYTRQQAYQPNVQESATIGMVFDAQREPGSLIMAARLGTPLLVRLDGKASVTEVATRGATVYVSRGTCQPGLEPPIFR